MGLLQTNQGSYIPIGALSLTTASGTNVAPVKTSGGSGTQPVVVSAVVKVTSTTIIYLNGTMPTGGGGQIAYGGIFAVQIA